MSTLAPQGTPFPYPMSSHYQSSLSAQSITWVPLDATIQVWADFGKEAMTASALVATGTAFLAFSWEASALHHYTSAQQEHQRGVLRLVLQWLGQTVEDLQEAIEHWHRAVLWLESLIKNEQQEGEILDTIHTLLQQAMEQHQRLQTLLWQVQTEQMDISIKSDFSLGKEVSQ
jgi:hypothetical protein